jgi:L-lactate dehydrogenase complex protein LldF
LREFEHHADASGAKVHWARDAQEACRIVVAICRSVKAKRVTRSKSMLGEEIGVAHALRSARIECVETDLAEHIVQLAAEAPSHIVWPAMHKTRADVAALFRAKHKIPPKNDDIPELVRSARRDLRPKFLASDVGISGANFLIADSGAVCTVTN